MSSDILLIRGHFIFNLVPDPDLFVSYFAFLLCSIHLKQEIIHLHL